jgi:Protein of unknown function (DUF742)
VPLRLETLVSVGPSARRRVPMEFRAVIALCEEPRSVAEIAALLAVPLGVAKVLVGDMAELDLIMVHTTTAATPTRALMRRVLDGLRRL